MCTIQTFPFALKAVQELSATQGKTFAVIADEAHSSQSGEAAAKLKQILSADEQQSLDDGGEVSTEDILAVQMAARAKHTGITYIAFTATPKAKTLELFGRRPDPSKPASAGNLPAPFHVYSMRQAIEEGFIGFYFDSASNGRTFDFFLSDSLNGGSTLFSTSFTVLSGINVIDIGRDFIAGQSVFALIDYKGFSGRTVHFQDNSYAGGNSSFGAVGSQTSFVTLDHRFVANFSSPAVAAVPEPTSLAVFAIGACVAGLGATHRRRLEKKTAKA